MSHCLVSSVFMVDKIKIIKGLSNDIVLSKEVIFISILHEHI